MSLGDVIFHMLCLAMAALCAVGGFIAEGPGRWVSFATGIAFLGGIAALWVIRIISRRADYVTRNGLRIRVGKLNAPDRLTVEQWTLIVIEHWVRHYPDGEVRKALDGHFVVFGDKIKVSTLGRWMAGLTTDTASWVGLRTLSNGKPDFEYVRRLFIHELSHAAISPFIPWDEVTHHDEFARTGLNTL